jgi:membrane fusion protein, heavy metal efflux system
VFSPEGVKRLLARVVPGVLSAALAGCIGGPVAEAPAPVAPEEQDVVRIDPSAASGGKVAWQAARLEALPQVLQVTGRVGVDDNRTSRIGAIVDGRVISIHANVGDRVEKGKLLARLHSHEVHDARAEYAKANSELQRREIERDYSKNARDRAAKLYQLKAASLEHVQRSEADLKAAEIGIKSAQAEINRIGEHLHHLGISSEGAEEEYTRAGAPGDFDEEELVPVVSPITGTVLKRFVSPGTVVTPASDLLLVSDLESLWIHAEVPEKFLGLVRKCRSASVKVHAYPERAFTARVDSIGDLLNPDTRTVEVRCSIRNADGMLKPEMYAAVTFEFTEVQQAVVIPASAVQDLNGQSVVFVREDDTRFRSRPVRLGRQTGDSVEVLEGVKAGDAVVSKGSFLLKSELLKRQMAGD